MLESNPPDKNVQNGLSVSNWEYIASLSKNFIFSQVVPKLSVCFSFFNFQYLSIVKPDSLYIAKWAGFISKIFLKYVVPGVCAGPIANNSQIPRTI